MRDRLRLCGALWALVGCTGYVDRVSPQDAALPVPSDASTEAPDQEPATDAGAQPEPALDAGAAVEETPPAPAPEPPSGDLRMASSAAFDGYLTDSNGRALYMFVDDKPTVNETACLDDCARAWPPFDVLNIQVGPGIDASEVNRFHRQDGQWQTRYKGFPLYYRAGEENQTAVTADGTDGRWFVARDYFAFMSSPPHFTPVEDPAAGARVMTDGYGNTLYVCLDDKPETAMTLATSSCTDDCLANRPPWVARATNRTTILPSVLNPTDLNTYVRPDGLDQLTYRGWPLYYFRGDDKPGAIIGHNQNAWRAIEPVVFGLQPTTAVSN